MNRLDVPANVTNNDEAHVDEAAHKRAIIGAHPTMVGFKQLKVDLRSDRVVSIDNDDDDDNNDNDIKKVGSAAMSNNDVEDHADNYGNNNDGEGTKKLATPTSDVENENDDDSYDDEETGWANLWCPMMPILDWEKFHEKHSV